MTKPKVRNEKHRLVQCPRCGLVAQVDEDQWHGRVSIDCPDCPYHETHDLSADERPATSGDEKGEGGQP